MTLKEMSAVHHLIRGQLKLGRLEQASEACHPSRKFDPSLLYWWKIRQELDKPSLRTFAVAFLIVPADLHFEAMEQSTEHKPIPSVIDIIVAERSHSEDSFFSRSRRTIRAAGRI